MLNGSLILFGSGVIVDSKSIEEMRRDLEKRNPAADEGPTYKTIKGGLIDTDSLSRSWRALIPAYRMLHDINGMSMNSE